MSNNSDAKVTVSYRGDTLSVWVTPAYTFGQLRRDAARYWNLKPSDATLLDGEGCAWPDDGHLNYAVRTGLVQRHGLVLCPKEANSNSAGRVNAGVGNRTKVRHMSWGCEAKVSTPVCLCPVLCWRVV
jgi:hypothetical protein